MSARRAIGTIAVLLAAASIPATGFADHVTGTSTVTAEVTEPTEDSVVIAVSWNTECAGAGPDAEFEGKINLVDPDTGEQIFVDYLSTGTGTLRKKVRRSRGDRRLFPALDMVCGEAAGGRHGDDTPANGFPIIVQRPGPRASPPAGFPGGACAFERRGTRRIDPIIGTAADERIVGLAGDDRLYGLDGDDCLIGGPGADTLHGGTGIDLLDGGGGRDAIVAVDRTRDVVRCGPGRDRVRADRVDRLSGCERVTRVR